MKYILNIRARPKADEAIPAKHDRFMRAVRSLPSPWAPVSDDWPAAAEAGTEPLSIVNLKRVLGPGVRGSLNYRNRKYLPDEAGADDWINLEFNPGKIAYSTLVNDVFPGYISALGAYVGTIKDAEFDFYDFKRWQKSGINERHGVFRIYPVNFYDRELCQRAFGLSPKEVVRRVGKQVERASVINGGVFLLVTSQAVSFAEAKGIDKRVRPLLVR